MNASRKVGSAYGFLKTGSAPKRISEAFRNMKAEPEVMVPANLELIVAFSHKVPINASFHGLKGPSQVFGLDNAGDLSQLLKVSVKMGEKGANCVIRAIMPEVSGEQTARELGHVFNLMYSCTEIMGDAQKPVADIFFKNEDGIYVSTLKPKTQS